MSSHSAKKRIVIATWGSFGDLHPFMAIALELKARGHNAVIATSPLYREKIEAAGINFHPVRPDMPQPESAEAVEVLRRVTDMRSGPEYVWRELLMRHVRDSYVDTLAAIEAEEGADLLISHTVAIAAPLAAAVTNVRWISTVLQPIVFVSAFDPNARRCVALGLARTLPRRRYTLTNVVRELNELLTNESYAARAAMIGERVRAEEGTREACDVIEEAMKDEAEILRRI